MPSALAYNAAGVLSSSTCSGESIHFFWALASIIVAANSTLKADCTAVSMMERCIPGNFFTHRCTSRT